MKVGNPYLSGVRVGLGPLVRPIARNDSNGNQHNQDHCSAHGHGQPVALGFFFSVRSKSLRYFRFRHEAILPHQQLGVTICPIDQESYSPAMVMPSIRTVGEASEPRNLRSLPISTML